MPPDAAAASNISPCSRQARSQLGSRLAVASMAKDKRPLPAPACRAGKAATRRRKASTAPDFPVAGSRLLSSPAFALRNICDRRAAEVHWLRIRDLWLPPARFGPKQGINILDSVTNDFGTLIPSRS